MYGIHTDTCVCVMCQAKAEMNIEATQLGRKETGFALRTLLTFMLLLVYKPLC